MENNIGVANCDLIMLYSGGADSRLMLDFALKLNRKVYCVLVDYGQKHIKELKYAEKHLLDLSILYQTVKIEGLDINSGLTGDLKSARWENVHSENVPGRNTFLISIAYSIAENLNIDEIWMGADYSDRENLFPDCYQDYIYKMNEVLKISGVRPIKLVAPLLGWTKEMVLDYLENAAKISTRDVYSGYNDPESN